MHAWGTSLGGIPANTEGLGTLVPDVVHVLSRGRIVRTGGKELALELEARGYAGYQDEAA